MTAGDPHVAWGMFALTLALKGKLAGGAPHTPRLLSGAVDLCRMHSALIPDDHAAALAAVRFTADCTDDPVAAGIALQEFLATWRKGLVADPQARAMEALASIAADGPPPGAAPDPAPPDQRPDSAARPFDWQTRADTGLD
ncbi:hypothetical protein N0B44_15680 [Roseibacterium beibuensis]|uniref:Uncharacterized protein n=1 Tax=[Roseibacterium] beibuensis TaxID=1193142 RepID=A0ABP9LB58_9RHOB|nr:hypothetical protein [Roseibacterium beibuensis]MCS6624359.1 hypothetical protein [Roseibacterium beibuensis]